MHSSDTYHPHGNYADAWGCLPRSLPARWSYLGLDPVLNLYAFTRAPVVRVQSRRPRLHVLLSAEYLKGQQWLHVSFSYKDRLPTYEDVMEVRTTFFKPEQTVLQIFPPEAQHVNVHPYTLHLWSNLDGSLRLIDLRREDGTI